MHRAYLVMLATFSTITPAGWAFVAAIIFAVFVGPCIIGLYVIYRRRG